MSDRTSDLVNSEPELELGSTDTNKGTQRKTLEPELPIGSTISQPANFTPPYGDLGQNPYQLSSAGTDSVKKPTLEQSEKQASLSTVVSLPKSTSNRTESDKKISDTSSDTKQPNGGIEGGGGGTDTNAPPSKSASNPYSCTADECINTPHQDHADVDGIFANLQLSSGRTNTLISTNEHQRAVRRMESDNKILEAQFKLEREISDDLCKENERIHEQHKAVQCSNIRRFTEMTDMTKMNMDVCEQLRKSEDQNRLYKRRLSESEIELRRSKEKLGELKKKWSQQLCDEVAVLNHRLATVSNERDMLRNLLAEKENKITLVEKENARLTKENEDLKKTIKHPKNNSEH